ncbi:Rrf2 family transcriptional regulator [uncultured Muriicola sp.]|uniref:RrF2 family transcriptional regulator n=1 Tax=uncultured Muriicola sp. TaxID=1583102 RepID=UPI00260170A8|nr:Rrf2 family transcriptional regulator [uncultured Muriicola sp.]
MLSNSSKYALKAVLYLANKTDESHKLMVKDLSEPTQVPKAYLAKLLQALSKQNIISATKGPKGGYYLTKENKENPVYSVIEVIDGNQRLEACVLGIDECNAQHPCPLHEYVNPTRTALLSTLKKMTIAELSLDLSNGASFLSR